jgi:nitrite reductase/ring-hydroxylating ferredoxin subunit
MAANWASMRTILHLLTGPRHAAHFDRRDGKLYQDAPWATDTKTFPVEVRGEYVYVEL